MITWIQYHEDRLVRRFERQPRTAIREFHFHGKRVGKDCPLTKDERLVYVAEGTVKALRFIMQSRGMRLSEAWRLLKHARGEVSTRRFQVRR